MSTNENDVGADPTAPQLQLQSVYLKDCSYEAPNGPRVQGEWNPQINLDLHTGVQPISTDVSSSKGIRSRSGSSDPSRTRSSSPSSSLPLEVGPSPVRQTTA